MANNISANTLFHFTRSIDNIIGILTNDFSPRFCMENQSFLCPSHKFENKFAIPMVCFCDIPLSEIKNHINNYGSYAIGLSKEWGKRNGINPVMYVVEDSYSSRILNETVNILYNEIINKEELVSIDGINDVKNSVTSAWRRIYDFTFYLKQYEGKRWNDNDFKGETVRFYDEREWRFVPDTRNMNDNQVLKSLVLTKQNYLNESERKKYNDRVANMQKLKFTPNDINYIIVQSENEVLEIEDKIRQIKGDKYSLNQLRKLTTRILCAERVLEDF